MRVSFLHAVVLFSAVPISVAGGRITAVMARNQDAFVDGDGDSSDW